MSDKLNQIRVLFFAHLRELTGTKELKMAIPATSTVGDLKKILVEKFPPLHAAMDHLIAAVNQNFAQDKVIIPENAEVAFFPPVSGGSEGITICQIKESGLSVDQTIKQITTPSTGGICAFTGVVRQFTPSGDIEQTEKLEYEAYKPMAENKMREIADEIRSTWPKVEGIALVQRIGVVDPGTTVAIVACSAPHRYDGIFEAARFGIDRLKEIVPVWKKEIGSNGEEWMEGSFIPNDSLGG